MPGHSKGTGDRVGFERPAFGPGQLSAAEDTPLCLHNWSPSLGLEKSFQVKKKLGSGTYSVMMNEYNLPDFHAPSLSLGETSSSEVGSSQPGW